MPSELLHLYNIWALLGTGPSVPLEADAAQTPRRRARQFARVRDSRAAHGYRARVPAVRSESFRSTQCWAPKLGIECLERSARTVNLEEGRPNMRRASAHRVVLTLILLFGSLGFASSASAECFKCVWQVGFGWLCAHTGPNESGKDYCTTASGGCQLAGTPCNTGGGCGGPANPCGPKDPTP